MKLKHLSLALATLLSAILMSFQPADRSPIDGIWIRKDDNLKIEIDKDHASIVQESREKFPCDVSSMLIYKDIRQTKTNHWTCNFLVVTMGSCITGYESGELFIDKAGELVVICPGFKSKIYQKATPRYGGSQN